MSPELDKRGDIRTDAARAIVQASGKSMRGISHDMDRVPTYLSSIIGQAERMDADLNASIVASVANACGYALALVPLGSVPDGAIVIDPPERS